MSSETTTQSTPEENRREALAWAYGVPIFIVSMGLLHIINALVFDLGIGTQGEPVSGPIQFVWRGIVLLGIPGFMVYWCLGARRGPGVMGIHSIAKRSIDPLASLYGRLDESDRVKVLLVPFSVTALALLYSVGWILLSDEAAEKHALTETFDSDRPVAWTHQGDSVDVLVYGSAAESLAGEVEGAPAVRLTYSRESLDQLGQPFEKVLHSDLGAASRGHLLSTTAESELVVTPERPGLDAIAYHGAFGVTGIGVMEAIIGMSLLVVGIAKVTISHPKSNTMAVLIVAFAIMSLAPAILDSSRESTYPQVTPIAAAADQD